MELINKNIHMNKIKCKSNMQLTLDDDFNVPDVKPDIERIVRDQGDITIAEIKSMNGKLYIKGELSFNLLYSCSDEGIPVDHISGKLPFEEYVNMDEACADNNIVVKWEIDDLSTTLINSRKISVRSIVSFTFIAEDLTDRPTAIGVEEGEQCQVMNKKLDITQIAVNTKDTYRIKDEVILPSGKATIYNELYYDMDLRNVDTRLAENKIMIKGEVMLFLLYISNNEEQPLQYYETELPFSGTIDCSGCLESMISDIAINVTSRNLEVKVDSDGEERVLDIEVVLELDVKAYEEDNIDILHDVYSTTKDIVPTVEECEYENILMKNNSKARISDYISLEETNRIYQICNSTGNIKVDETQVVPNGIQVDGVIDVQLLYILESDNKPLGSSRGSIPFSQVIEIKNIDEECYYDIKPSIEQLSVIMMDSSEAEVKVAINLDTIVFRKIKEKVIVDLSVEDIDMKKLQAVPSMIGYVVKPGDSLWSIAKQYYTTVDYIKELNSLENNNVQAGDRLLILKKVDAMI